MYRIISDEWNWIPEFHLTTVWITDFTKKIGYKFFNSALDIDMPRKGRPYFIKNLSSFGISKKEEDRTKCYSVCVHSLIKAAKLYEVVSAQLLCCWKPRISRYVIISLPEKSFILTTAFPYRFVLSTFSFLLNMFDEGNWKERIDRTIISLRGFSLRSFLKKRSNTVYIVNTNMLFFCDNKSPRSTRSYYCHPKHYSSLFLGSFERKDDWTWNNCIIIKAVIRMKEK